MKVLDVKPWKSSSEDRGMFIETEEGIVNLNFAKNFFNEDIFYAQLLNPEDRKPVWEFIFYYQNWVECPLKGKGKFKVFKEGPIGENEPEIIKFDPEKGIELPGFTLKFYKYFHVEAIFDNKALLIHFPISSYVFDYPAVIKEETINSRPNKHVRPKRKKRRRNFKR